MTSSVFGENSEGIILQNKNWLYFSPNYPSNIENSTLYNKITDPAEKNNVVAQYPELVNSLYEQVATLRSSYNSATMSGTKKTIDYSKINLDPEKVERLKKEGYY